MDARARSAKNQTGGDTHSTLSCSCASWFGAAWQHTYSNHE